MLPDEYQLHDARETPWERREILVEMRWSGEVRLRPLQNCNYPKRISGLPPRYGERQVVTHPTMVVRITLSVDRNVASTVRAPLFHAVTQVISLSTVLEGMSSIPRDNRRVLATNRLI